MHITKDKKCYKCTKYLFSHNGPIQCGKNCLKAKKEVLEFHEIILQNNCRPRGWGGKGNLFVFEVGPSIKFVSAIKDEIFNQKMGE